MLNDKIIIYKHKTLVFIIFSSAMCFLVLKISQLVFSEVAYISPCSFTKNFTALNTVVVDENSIIPINSDPGKASYSNILYKIQTFQNIVLEKLLNGPWKQSTMKQKYFTNVFTIVHLPHQSTCQKSRSPQNSRLIYQDVLDIKCDVNS